MIKHSLRLSISMKKKNFKCTFKRNLPWQFKEKQHNSQRDLCVHLRLLSFTNQCQPTKMCCGNRFVGKILRLVVIFGYLVKWLAGSSGGPCCDMSGVWNCGSNIFQLQKFFSGSSTGTHGIQVFRVRSSVNWKPAVALAAMLAQFLSVLASKQGSALLHIPERWTTHGRIKLSAGRNLFQRLYRCRCSSERKLRRMQHRDFESNTLLIWRGSRATVLKCRGPSSCNVTCPSKSKYLSLTSTGMHAFKYFFAAKRTQNDITLRKATFCSVVLLVQWTYAAASRDFCVEQTLCLSNTATTWLTPDVGGQTLKWKNKKNKQTNTHTHHSSKHRSQVIADQNVTFFYFLWVFIQMWIWTFQLSCGSINKSYIQA